MVFHRNKTIKLPSYEARFTDHEPPHSRQRQHSLFFSWQSYSIYCGQRVDKKPLTSIAGAGFEPTYDIGYEPTELPILYPAIMIFSLLNRGVLGRLDDPSFLGDREGFEPPSPLKFGNSGVLFSQPLNYTYKSPLISRCSSDIKLEILLVYLAINL